MNYFLNWRWETFGLYIYLKIPVTLTAYTAIRRRHSGEESCQDFMQIRKVSSEIILVPLVVQCPQIKSDRN